MAYTILFLYNSFCKCKKNFPNNQKAIFQTFATGINLKEAASNNF
jgi:hypothetical protein